MLYRCLNVLQHNLYELLCMEKVKLWAKHGLFNRKESPLKLRKIQFENYICEQFMVYSIQKSSSYISLQSPGATSAEAGIGLDNLAVISFQMYSTRFKLFTCLHQLVLSSTWDNSNRYLECWTLESLDLAFATTFLKRSLSVPNKG